jgi:hypothetical protein
MKSFEYQKMRKYWNNMMAGRCYTKGEFDSKTKQLVLATRKDNCFIQSIVILRLFSNYLSFI